MEFFYLCPKLSSMLEVAWSVILWSMLYLRAGHLDQVILLVWHDLKIIIKILPVLTCASINPIMQLVQVSKHTQKLQAWFETFHVPPWFCPNGCRHGFEKVSNESCNRFIIDQRMVSKQIRGVLISRHSLLFDFPDNAWTGRIKQDGLFIEVIHSY